MNAILICPSSRPAVEQLSLFAPLAAIPLLGESLAEYWLAHLAMTGVNRVEILASDRPRQIAAIVGNGARWGLEAQVLPEMRELTPAQAQIKYARELAAGSHEIIVLDHFPGSMQSLFTSYADLFAGIFDWLPQARMPDRIGLREIRAGVWAGLHTRISPEAQLHPPCWIGHNVYVGAGAVVGPMAVIEDRSFIEPKAQVIGSLIGPDTFVGQRAVIQEAFAFGGMLINWKSNVFTRVTDAFLLCALRHAFEGDSAGLFNRITQLYTRNKDDLQTFWKHFLLDKEDKLSTHDKV